MVDIAQRQLALRENEKLGIPSKLLGTELGSSCSRRRVAFFGCLYRI